MGKKRDWGLAVVPERIRLNMMVEGQTERNFAKALLAPHFGWLDIDLAPIVTTTNRKLNKRGGLLNYDKFAGDILRQLKVHKGSDVRFTTFVDLYALPNDFPRWDEASRQPTVKKRVEMLENALAQAVNDWRFVPYIQQHEFETLLYCDLEQVSTRIAGAEQGIAMLTKEVAGMAPEDINDGAATAPSKRLIRHVPAYERAKVRVGAPAAAAIGLDKLRADCPRFDAWISKLEQLPQALAADEGEHE